MDVEYFPFDEQTCVMKFGSWTYDGFQVSGLQNIFISGGGSGNQFFTKNKILFQPFRALSENLY